MNGPRQLPASSFPEELADLDAAAPEVLWILGSDAALAGASSVEPAHVAEALSYRMPGELAAK